VVGSDGEFLPGASEKPRRSYVPLDCEGDGTYRRFLLARGGLRSLRGTGEPFLGFAAGELFLRDVLELTHVEDLPRLRALISLLVQRPGGCGVAEVRVREAGGAWRPVVASFCNALEGPDGFGLLLADPREAADADGSSRPV
jgi:hypothetical protein